MNLTNATYLRDNHLREVIISLILASGSLILDTVSNSWRLEIRINSNYNELILLILAIIKDFDPVISTGSSLSTRFGMTVIMTRPDPFFNQFVDLFFDKENPSFKRIKPQLESELTPVVLAFLCMIDGAIKSGQSKGLRLITYGYHMVDLQLLCDMLYRVFNLFVEGD